MRFLLVFLGLPLLVSMQCWGEEISGHLDMSSEVLLSSSPKNIEPTGLQSGRYKQKKVKQLPAKKATNTKLNTEDTPPVMNPVTIVPESQRGENQKLENFKQVDQNKMELKTNLQKSLFGKDYKPANSGSVLQKPMAPQPLSPRPEETQASSTSTMVARPISGSVVNAISDSSSTTSGEVPLSEAQPSTVEQVKALVFGDEKTTTAIETYKEQVHEDDIRINQVEVSILPGFISNDSRSNYSFRNYSTSSPKLEIQAKFWLSPFLGIYGDYMTSMGGDVVSNAGTRSRVSAQHEISQFGFEIRKFYGLSRRANSLSYGMEFSEYKFTVPGDDMYRIKLRSSGLGFHIGARVPVAPSYAWVFGGKLSPRLQTKELPTGVDLSSGDLGESTKVELSAGGELKFSRFNQMIWSLSVMMEKNQYNGQASNTDPETGNAPHGVSVENRILMLSFGYRWGQ